MLNTISWSTFICWLGGAFILYYAGLFWVYYRKTWRQLLSGKKQGVVAEPQPAVAPIVSQMPGTTPQDETSNFKLAAKVSEQLKTVIQTTVAAQVERSDLISAVRFHLVQYRHLKGTKYGTAITNSIDRELKNNTITLTEAELKSIWLGS